MWDPSLDAPSFREDPASHRGREEPGSLGEDQIDGANHEKSKEAPELCAKIRTPCRGGEIEGRVDQKGDELVLKDELLEKSKEDLINDAANSYMVGVNDVVARATRIYPELDFYQLGLGKIVVDGRLLDGK
ncbi:hypothetical protein ACSQ67_024939 [Phaseolus vulgaris]